MWYTHCIYENETELPKYIWNLKNKDANFTIKWSIAKAATNYTWNTSTSKSTFCKSWPQDTIKFIWRLSGNSMINSILLNDHNVDNFLLTNYKCSDHKRILSTFQEFFFLDYIYFLNFGLKFSINLRFIIYLF